jgi:hypothetical protein
MLRQVIKKKLIRTKLKITETIQLFKTYISMINIDLKLEVNVKKTQIVCFLMMDGSFAK